uniref:Lipoprotein n=1 Tax=viral metagenome TaxID=1070528 RepID=A0A6M3LSZ3_9ZZZZ
MKAIILIVALAMAACSSVPKTGNEHPVQYQVRIDMRTCHLDDAERDTLLCWEEAQVKWPVTDLEIKKGGKGWARMAQRAVVIDCLEQKGYRIQPKGEPNWF